MNTVSNLIDPVIAANPDLKTYRVTLLEEPGDRFAIATLKMPITRRSRQKTLIRAVK